LHSIFLLFIVIKILTTETETNIPIYFSDEIKTVATSRHPSKCLV